MCRLCEDAEFGPGKITIVSRPAHQLAGVRWNGQRQGADQGAIASALDRVRDFSNRRADVWKSPIVGLANNLNADKYSCFVGVFADDDEQIPREFELVRVEEMDFAALSLGHQGCDIGEQYSRLRAWVDDGEYDIADVGYVLREEYAHEVDFQDTQPLRLMLPVVLR